MTDAVQLYTASPAELRRILLRENHEALASLSDAEKSAFAASTQRLFAEYLSLDEIAGDIARTLKWTMRDLGCKPGDVDEMNYLCIRIAEVCRRYYSNFSIDDFRLAFEMSVTGELDPYLPKRDGQADRGHYQSFSLEYVGKILTAYRGYRARAVNKVLAAIPPRPEPRNPEQEAEFAKLAAAECREALAYYGKNGELPPMSPAAERVYYNVLVSLGHADPVEEDDAPDVRSTFAAYSAAIAGQVPVKGTSRIHDKLVAAFDKLKGKEI